MKKTMGLLSILLACSVFVAMLAWTSPALADDDGGVSGGTCVGDVNGDGVVNVQDLLLVLSEWGCTSDCNYDVNGDGIVNVMDVLLVLANWGPCDGAPQCETAADCDDGDPCTINFCLGGVCVDAPNPHPSCQ